MLVYRYVNSVNKMFEQFMEKNGKYHLAAWRQGENCRFQTGKQL